MRTRADVARARLTATGDAHPQTQKGADIAADPHCLDLYRLTRAANGVAFAFRSPGSGAILLRVSAPATLVASAAFGSPRSPCLGIVPAKPLFPVKKRALRPFRHQCPCSSSQATAQPGHLWKPASGHRPCRRSRDCRPATILDLPPRSTPGFLAAPWRFPWHKRLMSLRFLASSSLAYSRDAVTTCESHQPLNSGRAPVNNVDIVDICAARS